MRDQRRPIPPSASPTKSSYNVPNFEFQVTRLVRPDASWRNLAHLATANRCKHLVLKCSEEDLRCMRSWNLALLFRYG